MIILNEEIRKLHSKGTTQKQISCILNCGITTVRRRMREMGLKGKSNGSRNYQINSSIFDIIDTEEKAYWLGFFLADACIAKSAGTRRAFRLALKKQDKKHVEKAACFLGYKGHIVITKGINPQARMVFNDVELCGSLMRHGWWNYKTGTSFEILNIISKSLYRHYIRGYFDGDGCISYGRRKKKDGSLRNNKDWYVNIVCKYNEPLKQYARWLAPVAGVLKEPKKRKTVYSLTFNGNNKVNRILDWLYDDAIIYLNRKCSRKHEFDGLPPFCFNNIGNFHFNICTDELIARKDHKNIIDAFARKVFNSVWNPPIYDYDSDYGAIGNTDCLCGKQIIAKSAAGNKFILKYQKNAWYVKQNRSPSITEFAAHKNMTLRAIKNFCAIPGRALTPQRFIRELRFAGFTMASLLATPIVIAAIDYFGLCGKWFDPCAGWGNRLLAAHNRQCDYTATDPGISYNGLVKINEHLMANAVLYNKQWQDLIWPYADFILTSPPFFNKEDYLDGVNYGTFNDWYANFLKPLVSKSIATARTILHVDLRMKTALHADFNISELPIISNSRHKTPKEWFIELRGDV